MERKYVTPSELQKIIPIKTDNLYNQLREGRIPSTKIGRNYFIPIKFIEDLDKTVRGG